ncbi:hypothetical protein WN55_08566 [Dufourea novaeangliae]|uniref:Uncharacterized protein n=1 Tax=Dufourea novaeangliae TaxID=178035 RepID=A0A154P770_DUFNO|nr:hypothetical protein WN55_08566 [Dufourea novaeangliae]
MKLVLVAKTCHRKTKTLFQDDLSVTRIVNSSSPLRACRNLNVAFNVSPRDIIPIPKITTKGQRV